jgi:hypothetical protein
MAQIAQAADAPIDWRAIEDAIHSWFATATGIEVVWQGQDTSQLRYPFGTLNIISGPTKIGGDDEQRSTTNLSAPAGKEVTISYTGNRQFTVSCQINVGKPDDNDPDCNARHLMSVAAAQLETLPTKDALNAVDLSVATVEGVNTFDLVVGGEWTSRVQMDVIFNTVFNLTDLDSGQAYMANAGITATLDDQGNPIVEDFSTS